MSFTLCFSPIPPGNVAIMHRSSCSQEDVTAFEAGQRERQQDGSLVASWWHLLQPFRLETSGLCDKNKSLFGLASVVRFPFHGISESQGRNNNSRGRKGKKEKKRWDKMQYNRKLSSHALKLVSTSVEQQSSSTQ